MRTMLLLGALALAPVLSASEANAWRICFTKATKQCGVAKQCKPPAVAVAGYETADRRETCRLITNGMDEELNLRCGKKAAYGCS